MVKQRLVFSDPGAVVFQGRRFCAHTAGVICQFPVVVWPFLVPMAGLMVFYRKAGFAAGFFKVHRISAAAVCLGILWVSGG